VGTGVREGKGADALSRPPLLTPHPVETRKLGRYEIVGELGKGAMGVVYCARDPLLDRTVAIKTVNMELAQDEMAEYEARFYQEAKAAGGLNHPNIVIIYDIGKNEKIAYMAMELLQGKELKTLLASGKPLPVPFAADVAAQMAEGLGYAHEHGIVHRDIKPANIMIVRGELVKITDFGIARMRTANVQTQVGIVLGSPRYMSPEQVAGKRAEPRSDIFSVGVILYEMVTGKPPFNGEDVTSVMFQILNFVPPPPSTVNPEVPEVIDFIVAKALTKVPTERYASAREMASDLRDCLRRLPAVAETPATATTTGKRAVTSFRPEAADFLAKTAPATRRADIEPEIVQSQPPALGLSKAFDSLDATMRLAIQTGATADPGPLAATTGTSGQAGATTPGTGGYRVAGTSGWSNEDKMIFTASVAGATVVGALIVLL
jgi:eukaryotic-like serine/threonine-protein kinase